MTQKEHILVFGAGGMLGHALVPYFESKGHRVLATDLVANHTRGIADPFLEKWLEYCDVRDFHAMHYFCSEFHPTIIFNLAAMTDLEECESYTKQAIDTNTGGSANCAALAMKFDIPYVYISTAGIFSGRQEYYCDWDQPEPLCVYAKTKYWGELIAQTVPKHHVLRCGWQMGSGPHDKKLINKLWKQIKSGTTELNLVTDKQGTPTYVKDFSMQIEKLMETKSYGIFNSVCKGEASRYDVAVEFVRLLGLQDKIKINVVPSEFFAKEYFAPRPASEKLLTKRLDAQGLNVMRPWQEALAEYVTEYADYFKLEN
jgi:dTDP-4-dehydrorhamnose reductase